MTITNFSMEYDAINSKNVFTSGDTINGRIVVEVSKETTVQALVFTAKGYAKVYWTEHHNHGHHGHYGHPGHGHTQHYWADEKYYDVEQQILRESRGDGTEVIGKGRHVFPFSFKIPDRKMPSTFKDSYGKVVHKLKAELKQSMKFTKKAKTHITFVSQADLDYPMLWDPQSGCKDKSLSFGSGSVTMDVRTKQMGYVQGDDLQVTVDIRNQSSRSVKPKFTLYEKKSYFAQGHRKVCTKDVIKEKAEVVPSSDKESLVKVITIPKELPPSILNCSILKVEYRLKVELDIKYAIDPEIKLPIVVLPVFEQRAPQPTPAGPNAFGNPIPPAWNNQPQYPLDPSMVYPPPPYGAHAMYPPLNPNQYPTK